MSQVVCNYAPIRFLPYREIGEFVTVGVVLHFPQIDLFAFRLLPLKRTARVAAFFPELDIKIFKAAIKGIQRELVRIQGLHGFRMGSIHAPEPTIQKQMRRFHELIRRREGLLHFGDPGTLLAEDPRGAVKDIFDRFVNRQFAHKKEYQEAVMRNRLAKFLNEWHLSGYYEQNKQIGDDEFHVSMPFVYSIGGNAVKVIKPLDLNKEEPSDIYHHGGTWVKNMERLKARGKLPPAAVFTTQMPKPGSRQLGAANTICDELKQLGIETVDFDNLQEIRDAVDVRSGS